MPGKLAWTLTEGAGSFSQERKQNKPPSSKLIFQQGVQEVMSGHPKIFKCAQFVNETIGDQILSCKTVEWSYFSNVVCKGFVFSLLVVGIESFKGLMSRLGSRHLFLHPLLVPATALLWGQPRFWFVGKISSVLSVR